MQRERLRSKLAAKGIHEKLVAVLDSWLEDRTASVLVDGQSSDRRKLSNMVFQGTVLGPMCWNAMYADSCVPLRENGFTEVLYADDLNGYREYERSVDDHVLLASARKCQRDLHSWGGTKPNTI